MIARSRSGMDPIGSYKIKGLKYDIKILVYSYRVLSCLIKFDEMSNVQIPAMSSIK